jgi:hypothetical protein
VRTDELCVGVIARFVVRVALTRKTLLGVPLVLHSLEARVTHMYMPLRRELGNVRKRLRVQAGVLPSRGDEPRQQVIQDPEAVG